jgi:hypothetical protein
MTYPSAAGGVANGYCVASGTSFAAPFVTGAVGLLAAARPELADADFQHLLRAGAADLGAPGPDSLCGAGRLDLASALVIVRHGIAIWHDEAPATTIRSTGIDTLAIAEDGGLLGHFHGVTLAERYEVQARVVLPDSFADLADVWPRVSGTSTVRGAFRTSYLTPWAEVVDRDARGFTLRGHVFHALGAVDPGDAWIPVPPDQARFGFTVLGVTPSTSAARVMHAERLRAAPNPFRTSTRIEAPRPGRLMIHDLAGRLVHASRIGTERGMEWDGRGLRGEDVAPGLYFVRLVTEAGILTTRLLRF